MKIRARTKGGVVFVLSKREAELLLSVLRLYPRLPPAHQPISRKPVSPGATETQRMLDEALAEHRAENKKALETLLKDPRRFEEQPAGCRLSLTLGEVEWLLQVLNDVRVGSWVLLGSPEQKINLDPKNAAALWAMEMSGYFQMEMLHALEGRS